MRFSSVGVTCALLLLLAGCDYTPYQIVTPPVDPPVGAVPEGLWSVSGSPGQILRLEPGQLLTEGVREPATKLFTSSASLFTLNSVAFDSAGTMWVASADDSLLLAFAPGNAAASGATTPGIIISARSRSIAGPTGIAFDNQHGIWLANQASGTIVRFDRSQLTTSGSPVPSVTISGVAHPTGLAFDASGALWVSDIQANTMSRYLPGQLLTSGDKPPAIVLSAVSGSLKNPSGIAFDSFNNMWVANSGDESVVAFRPPQRGSTGSPTPFITLKSAEFSLGSPSGLAFDPIGNLWVIGVSGVLTKFRALEIAASGPVVPSLQIRIPDRVLFWSIAFWPKPEGFPLN